VTAPLPLDRWLGAQREALDAALQRFVPTAAQVPSLVAEAMRYSVFAGGKRLRPMLVLAAAEAIAARDGLDSEQTLRLALPAACALEMIHTYSLVHDDLPAMDNDTLRRGRPTAHVVYGEGTAILSGDALLTEALALLAREPQPASGDAVDAVDSTLLAVRKLAALEVIADAAGASGMVGGQAIDLAAAAPGAAPLDADGLGEMHARKTGALLRASAVAGAVMAGGRPDVIAAIGEYGSHVGLAFQIVDDILDVEGDPAALGKTTGKDAAGAKPTYPALFGLAQSQTLAAECRQRAHRTLADAGLTGGWLGAIADWVVSRKS
jgi:geranylgeranyl diphosphate synthase, type II